MTLPNRAVAALLLVVGVAPMAWAEPDDAALRLSVDGQSLYVIVVAEDAIAPEHTAAEELRDHLEAVTGARLPIRSEAEAGEASPRIVVGPGPAFRAAFPDLDLATLKHDGIVMRRVDETLYLAGGRPRGTLYAVYTFLEDVVGCRWWTATERFVPHTPTLALPALDVVYVPQLQCREAFYRGAFDGVFAARCKCNGHFEQVPPEYGGHYSILGWCHTFNQILPPEKYFEQHPEWYSEIEGKRVAERSQLCLTNLEMRAEFVKNALERLRADPDAGIISISQNDCHGQCQCPKCRALEQHEGAASGPVIHFVNAVAAEIEKEFPEVLVETLAYSYTRQAPRHVRPRKNVLIRLCSIECSFSQPLATGPQNEAFSKDIEAWSAIAHQLYIWDYVTNFRNYILPHPNLRVLAPNIRFFVDHKAIGLFEQGDSQCACGDFVDLRAWVLAHLMWDPPRDPEALVAEFLNGYYGAAAEPLQQYLDHTHDAVERSGAYLRCYMEDTAAWLNLEDLERATDLFDEAERRVAGDPVLGRRVSRARMPLDHVWLKRYHALRRVVKHAGRPWRGPEDPVAFCDAFVGKAYDFDVGSYAESRPFNQYEPLLRGRFRPPASAPAECEGLDADDWVDVQDNECRLHGYGTLTTIIDDPKASDGKAARMPADHKQWAVQYPVSADLAALGALRCCVVARCQPKAESGPAFQLGIYDIRTRADVARQDVPIEDAQYHTYDLGVHTLTDGMYFWVAPMKNPDQVEAVYVDRIFCMREK